MLSLYTNDRYFDYRGEGGGVGGGAGVGGGGHGNLQGSVGLHTFVLLL